VRGSNSRGLRRSVQPWAFLPRHFVRLLLGGERHQQRFDRKLNAPFAAR
jgi:hypothetical protein